MMNTIAHADIEMPEPTQSAIYHGIGDTLDYLAAHWQEQPSLDLLAKRAGWSLSHFQRAFTDHVGVSPKRVLQYLTIAHARGQLADGASLLEASLDSGLSGPGRLHDLFVAVEAMTPGEYKKSGSDLTIAYGWCRSLFGPVMLGVTERGICWLAFDHHDRPEAAEQEFHTEWSLARRVRDDAAVQPVLDQALGFMRDWQAVSPPVNGQPPRLLLRGTNFQLKVWHALLSIPAGQVYSYGQIAEAIGAPKATRAVGAACGANLVSALIPCHRAITSTGMIHAYRWGVGRKRVQLACEFARFHEAQAAG